MSTPSASKVESASFRERQTPTPDRTGTGEKIGKFSVAAPIDPSKSKSTSARPWFGK